MNTIKLNQWSFKLKLRLIFGVVLFCVFILFLFAKIVPGGKISYSFSQHRLNNFFAARGAFRDFRPGLRMDLNDKNFLKVISDPLYFRIFSPRNFNKARITLKYDDKLSDESPIIEMGLLKGTHDGNYELKPVENKIIDSLSSSWNKLESDAGFLILQKEKNYDNENNFWQDFNDDRLLNCSGESFGCTTFYNYILSKKYSSLESIINPGEINQALRGSHQFFVYFKEGEWFLDFSLRNLGLESGGEKVEVKVFSGQELIAEKYLVDNDTIISGEAFNNNEPQGEIMGKLEVQGKASEEALYRVEVKASDDVVIEQIKSSSDHIVFINKLWPVYEKNVSSFFTTVNNLSVKTFETESLGEVNFANNITNLDKTYYNLELQSNDYSREVKGLELEKTGILIELNGVIALAEKNYFNPVPNKLDRFFSSNKGISYLIADYDVPQEDGDFKVATIDFDLSGANIDNGFYSFVISIPGLSQDSNDQTDEVKNYLKIKEIKIEFEGKNIFAKIKEKLNDWRRNK